MRGCEIRKEKVRTMCHSCGWVRFGFPSHKCGAQLTEPRTSRDLRRLFAGSEDSKRWEPKSGVTND
jgi:hypothetical protein